MKLLEVTYLIVMACLGQTVLVWKLIDWLENRASEASKAGRSGGAS